MMDRSLIQQATRDYNELPLDTRKLTSVILAEQRIQHLKFEKDRLRRMYQKGIAEIDKHIKNIESDLKELLEEIYA